MLINVVYIMYISYEFKLDIYMNIVLVVICLGVKIILFGII